ncbi:hypothetical protein [Polynucleobacter sp. JS-Polo-80-F4]|uniref:hypothetical protein n=1 Tax=Polynucleobacter sp. JS-Polo-80-F4 TaxID=2576918 RepID=UPI001C0C051F|nr:hypothetical protein [Polynucleobacter sp. JS-Polo-80-F4]MBU3617324.1 hypothetical protein [Polynucleobacter sp. JS-Polo-80-F4]
MGHIVGGHIGGISMELLQIGCICPFTHWQVHAAEAAKLAKENNKVSNNFFISISW